MLTQNRVSIRSAFQRAFLATALMGAFALTASAKSKGDIGSPKPEGKCVQSGDQWTITAGGADIFGPSDQFHFASSTASGNSVLTAKIVSVGDDTAQSWAKAGLMIRADDGVGSPHACIAITRGGTLIFMTRATPGGDTRSEKIPHKTLPIYLKLERKGNDFTSSYSEDGKTWSNVGKTMTVPMKPATLAGMAVTSHQDGSAVTAVFSNFVVRR